MDEVIACHFFTPDEIELDLDPAEVSSQGAMDSVLRFMGCLGSCLGRDVTLTEENSPERI